MAIDTDNRVINRTVAALKRGIPYKLHQGGTSSGKTFGILYALLFFALKYMPARSIVSIVSLNFPHLKRGAMRDFKKIIYETGMASEITEDKTNHVFHLPRSITFEFFATDDEGKAKSGKRDYLFMNEADSIEWSIANQLMIRTNVTTILDWNPSSKYWLHSKLLKALKKEEYVFTRSTWRDNKSASKRIIAEIERLKEIDPVMYDIYSLGIEGKGKEIIYPVYKLVDTIPEYGRKSIGLDFGFTNHPSAAVICCYNDGHLWFQEIFYEKGLSNKDIYERLKRYRLPIVADSNEPKSISELYDLGLTISGAVKGQDSVKFGIDKVKEYPINVTSASDNLTAEMDGYKWIMVDGEPTNQPVKKNDHLMDALRYGIQAILTKEIPMQPQVRRASEMGFTALG